jgi:hypothetical protein
LVLKNASGQVFAPTPAGDGFATGSASATFTSLTQNPTGNGYVTNPGALNIEFDAPVYPFHTSQGRQWIRVWGVGLGMIGQAANLNGATFALSGGMATGLPLATAAAGQAGLLFQGTVFAAYGNWQGTNQTLELIVNPTASNIGSPGNATNISWTWKAGQNLAAALGPVFSQAYGSGVKTSINVSPGLTAPATDQGTYPNLQSFAQHLLPLTQSIGAAQYGSTYPGVAISVAANNTVTASDGVTLTGKLIFLAFQDLIGQPTWINPNQVSFKTVLRSDIQIGNWIKFPAGVSAPYALTNAGAAVPNTPAASKTAFQGKFCVTEVHHFANLRQADADSWSTAFTAAAIPNSQ